MDLLRQSWINTDFIWILQFAMQCSNYPQIFTWQCRSILSHARETRTQSTICLITNTHVYLYKTTTWFSQSDNSGLFTSHNLAALCGQRNRKRENARKYLLLNWMSELLFALDGWYYLGSTLVIFHSSLCMDGVILCCLYSGARACVCFIVSFVIPSIYYY